MDTKQKLSGFTVSLHWIVAIAMIGLLAMGFYMKNLHVLSLIPLHKSLGLCVLLIVLVRVVWRIINGWPKHVSEYARHEIVLAKIVHWILILGTLAMPLSGFMLSAASGYGVSFFGMEIVARNPDPSDPGKVIALSPYLNSLGRGLHHWVGLLLTGAIVMHIAGALKHHLFDKDKILTRMFGKTV